MGLSAAMALTSVVGAGCVQRPPERPDASMSTEMAPDFSQKVPLNIAVLPAVNTTGKEVTIIKAFREYAKDALVDRWYSPIAFSAIDSRVGPRERFTPWDLDRLRGTFEEDAILACTLSQWDASTLRKDHKVLAGGDFALYDSKSGSKLWTVSFADYWVKVDAGPRQISAEDFYEYEHRAMKAFVQRFFAEFPKRASSAQG
jgi:hypothetical protein